MQEMLRKKFRLEIEFFGLRGESKIIVFSFWQGSLRDLLKMKESFRNAESSDEWLFDFLMKKTEQSDKLTASLYSQLIKDHRNSILDYLIKTFAKNFFKTVDGVPNVGPSSSLICTILEQTSETMETLLNMTWEQIEYLIEGIEWNFNEGNKEGKEKNRRNFRRKEMMKEMTDEDALAQAKAFEERIKQRKKA